MFCWLDPRICVAHMSVGAISFVFFNVIVIFIISSSIFPEIINIVRKTEMDRTHLWSWCVDLSLDNSEEVACFMPDSKNLHERELAGRLIIDEVLPTHSDRRSPRKSATS